MQQVEDDFLSSTKVLDTSLASISLNTSQRQQHQVRAPQTCIFTVNIFLKSRLCPSKRSLDGVKPCRVLNFYEIKLTDQGILDHDRVEVTKVRYVCRKNQVVVHT